LRAWLWGWSRVAGGAAGAAVAGGDGRAPGQPGRAPAASVGGRQPRPRRCRAVPAPGGAVL